ncbi:MAG TPA: TIGR02710 family CRISPR-associated CARF protein, partial [Terrimicrobiaceae bacterium]
KKTLPNIGDASRKTEFSALLNLANALADWERFEHGHALNKFTELSKHANNLEAVLGYDFTPRIARAKSQLEAINNMPKGAVSMALTVDLLANASRRIQECRYDDAVARLYRAIEALAQVRLQTHGFADTAKVPLDQVPEPIRSEWQTRARNGMVSLGLQDDYALLEALGDELGSRFKEKGMADRDKSPLVSRNSSILAHGFFPVGEAAARQLFKAALALASIEESSLTAFPSLTHN